MGKVWVVNGTTHRIVFIDAYVADTIQGRYRMGDLNVMVDPNKKICIKTYTLKKLAMANGAFQKIQVWRSDNNTMIKPWHHNEFCEKEVKYLVFSMVNGSITYSFVETAEIP